ncbi:MAG: phosphatidate cytidylyltransferase [Anaerolineales bacterium]|nr:phosphatidate cytidylyltransferase [Anaerolineales bacterium]
MPLNTTAIEIAALVAVVLANATASNSIGSRVLAAAVMMPLAIGLTWAGDWAFSVLILACAGMIAREWGRLCEGSADTIPVFALVGGTVTVIAGATALQRFDAGIVACILLYFALRKLPAGGRSDRSRVWLAAGALTIIPAGLSLIWLRTVPENGLELVIWLFAVVWTTDTAAFAVGRTIGGPRLAPMISPSKTWAGLIGGLTGATLMGFLLAYAIMGQAAALAALTGLIIGLASGIGDLFESYVKRRFRVKDSGGLIPGHGGFLDRLDSLLAAAPVAVCLFLLDWRWL